MAKDDSGTVPTAGTPELRAWVWAHRKWMDWARDLLTESNPSDSTLIEDMLASELRSALTKACRAQRKARAIAPAGDVGGPR